MKRIFHIAFLKVNLLIKDRAAFISMLLAPIIFVAVLVLGFGSGGGTQDVKYPMGIIDKDKGSYGAQLIEILKKDKSFEIVECDYEQAKNFVQDGKIAMGVVIPEGFSKSIENGKNSDMEIVKLQHNETTIALTSVVNNYIYQLRVGSKVGETTAATLSTMNLVKSEEKSGIKQKVETAFRENMNSPKLTYEAAKVVKDKNSGLDGMSYTAIGILVMFIMFFVTRGAGSILEEKEQGTWTRVQSTPVGENSVISGYIIGNFIIGWIQVGILIIVSRFVFRVNWGSSALAVVILFSSFLAAVIGLGAAMASLVKTKAQLSALSPIVVIPTSLLAGCMWSREVMPDIMLRISNYMPQTWVIKGMTDLVTRGSDINAVFIPSAVLLLFASIFFITGITLTKLQNRAGA